MKKKHGNLSDAQFAAHLEHLNVGWDKPKDWDIVDEIGQGEASLAHAKRASEEYLAGRGKHADQSYDQVVATPLGNLRAQKQEFSLHAYQDMDEATNAVEESVGDLKTSRFRALRLSQKCMRQRCPSEERFKHLKNR